MSSECIFGSVDSSCPPSRPGVSRALLQLARAGSVGRRAAAERVLSESLVRDARAIRLIQLGARVSLVCKLTGAPRATAKNWYQQIHGKPSPPGLAPFTDAWYVKTEHRMLHSNIVWKISRATEFCADDAQALIVLAEAYLSVVRQPLLDLMHLYFLPRLLTLKLWREDVCKVCAVQWIRPVDELNAPCPACRILALYRCRKCDGPMVQKKAGRRATLCEQCRK